MEAVRTSETSVDNLFTRQYNPEDSSEHHTRRRENLKSHIGILCEISSLMMEAVRTSETSVDNHFTRQYIPEDNSEHHRYISLVSCQMFQFVFCCRAVFISRVCTILRCVFAGRGYALRLKAKSVWLGGRTNRSSASNSLRCQVRTCVSIMHCGNSEWRSNTADIFTALSASDTR
jgi:hypothetical protein